MLGSTCVLLKRLLSSALSHGTSKPPLPGIIVCWGRCGSPFPPSVPLLFNAQFSARSLCELAADADGGGGGAGRNGSVGGASVLREGDAITSAEAKKLMRLVNVEELKVWLGMQGKEEIRYSDLLDACQNRGVARSLEEAAAFARVLDDAGVVLLFRDKVYLHPEKVVDLIRQAVPLDLAPDDDPRKHELKKLQEKKEEIDRLAHKQVWRILWSGLGLSLIQVGLFFRLTFWEFSWDVMEPIAFFTTETVIVIGYTYFLFTSGDPTYRDLMARLLNSRQRKLFKAHNFDVERFMELQKKCISPLDVNTSVRGHFGAGKVPEDALRRH